MSADESKSSMVSVSSTSSKTNVSESSQHKNAGLGQSQVFPLKGLPLANDSNTLTNEKLEQPITGASDLSETQSLITFTKQISSLQEKDEKLTSPKQDQYSGLAGLSSVTPDSLGQKAQDSPDDKIIRSSESTPTPPGSGSPQLDQLLSDLEEMTLKFIPEKLDPPLSESSDESPDIDEIYKFEDLSPEDQCPMQDGDSVSVSVLSVIQPTDDHKNVGVIDPTHFQTPIQDEPELVSVIPNVTEISEANVQSSHGTHIDNPVFPTVPISIPESAKRLCEDMKSSLNSEGFPLDVFQSSENGENAIKATFSVSSQNDIPEQNLANISEEDTTTDILQGQDEQESSTSFDSSDMTKETSTQSIQDQLPSLFDMTSVKPIHNEDLSSQSLSGLFSETVTTARHFMFEELNSHLPSGSFKTPPNEDIPRTSEEYSDKSLTPECFDAQTTSFKDKTEITSSNSDEEYSIPTGYAETSSTTAIYTYMPPGYTEVMGGDVDSLAFEYSDPEPYFDCKQTGSDFSETEPDEPESRTRSSGGQQQEHFSQKGYRGVLLSSGSEDYEDAPFVHESFHDIPEENEELINDSEGSDEEFTLCEASQLPPVSEIGICDDTDNSLKRTDEMPDLPAQSVTEEKYKDENGHIVVKRVTRKIIRKCVSADGVEHAEVSLEGTPQESISVAEGDGYSKVVKRTVLKSEGDQTEVTFVECEGASALREEPAESGKVSRIERTTVVEAERTMTHQGDPSLASDLPSAQDDFKQALNYIGGFSRTELPHVVERETVKEDGTVVRRAHMHKGCTRRRTVVKGAGQRKQVLLEKVDNRRKRSIPRDLQQHLHQLFHHYHKEAEEDNSEDEDEEEED